MARVPKAIHERQFLRAARGTSTKAPQDPPNPLMDPELLLHADLQNRLEAIDSFLRARYGLSSGQTAVGLVDLNSARAAMIRPDDLYYAASVSKLAILLAYFQLNPDATADLPPETRHDLGLMIKASSNEAASRFSRKLGLANIQQVLSDFGFYDSSRGGIWMGKHYGEQSARLLDPVSGHSHAANVRQLLRFYLLLEQGKLISPKASRVMQDIFASPAIPHDPIKFVAGLRERPVQLMRKWGSWEDWLHDTAVITGAGRHYILVGLTHHPRGDQYLVDLARAIDDLLSGP